MNFHFFFQFSLYYHPFSFFNTKFKGLFSIHLTLQMASSRKTITERRMFVNVAIVFSNVVVQWIISGCSVDGSLKGKDLLIGGLSKNNMQRIFDESSEWQRICTNSWKLFINEKIRLLENNYWYIKIPISVYLPEKL